MRSRTSHAAESGVGEHTARESGARQAYITSSSGRCYDRSSDMTQELSGEARLETALEPS